MTRNSRMPENFTRSTSEPMMRQHVIAAKVAWKATNTSSYIGVALLKVAPSENVPDEESNVPFRKSRSKPPMNSLPVVNAREYPYTHHSTVMSENPTNTCISTDSMFFERTRPP